MISLIAISILICFIRIEANAFVPNHKTFKSNLDNRHIFSRIPVLFSRGGSSLSESTESKTDMSDTLEPLKFYALENGTCPYAARTLIALTELGLPFETIVISKRNKPDWFLEINPRGKVPAIQDLNGVVVYESAICDEYVSDLSRSYDTESTESKMEVWKLKPTSPSNCAKMRLLNDHIDTQINPAQFTFLMNKDSTKDDDLKAEFEKKLSVLEKTIEEGGGPYLMGSYFTLADVHFLPFYLRLRVSLKYFKEYDVVEKFPKLEEWFQMCSEKESVKAAYKTDEEIIDIYKVFVSNDYKFGGLNKN